MAEQPLDVGNTQGVPLDPGNYQNNEVPLDTGETNSLPINPKNPPVPGRKPEPPADYGSGQEDLVEGTHAPILDQYMAARDAGHSWTDIDSHIGEARMTAANFGYTDQEIDQHLGYTDPASLVGRATASWMSLLADDPTIAQEMQKPTQPDEPAPLPLFNENTMDEYKRALLAGEVKGPQDFAEQYAKAHGQAMDIMSNGVSLPGPGSVLEANIEKAAKELAPQLPTVKEVTDASLGLAQLAGDPMMGSVIRQNVLDEWSNTGDSPTAIYQKAINDPDLAARLTSQHTIGGDIVGAADAVAGIAKGVIDTGVRVEQAAQAGVLAPFKRIGEGLWNTVLEPDFYKNLPANLMKADTAIGQAMAAARADGGPLGMVNAYAAGAMILMGTMVGGALDLSGELMSPAPLAVMSGGSQLLSEALQSKANTPEESERIAEHFMTEYAIPLSVMMGPLGLTMAAAEHAQLVKMGYVDPLKPVGETLRIGSALELYRDVMRDESGQLKPTHTIEPVGEVKPTAPGEEPGPQRWSIKDPTGAPTGTALITKTGSGATIESIRYTGEGSTGMYGLPNSLGPRAVRDVFRDFMRQNPDVDTISGYRVTGARTVEGQEGARVISMTREQIMRQPGKIYEELGVSPSDTVQALTSEHGLADLSNTSVRQVVENMGGSKASVELAGGYDMAHAIYHTFRDIVADQTGAKPNPFALARIGLGRDYAQQQLLKDHGLSQQFVAQQFKNLEPYRAVVNDHMPAFLEQLKLGPAGNLTGDPIHEMNKFITGRSTGAQMDPNSPLRPVADALREVYQAQEERIKAAYPDWAKRGSPGWVGLNGFQEDYMRNLWARPGDFDKARGTGRQGNTTMFKKMTIGYVDGIEKHNLIPRHPNPIDNALAYIQQTDAHLAAKNTLDTSHTDGFVKYAQSQGNAPEGWQPLEGAMTEKLFVDAQGRPGKQQAYAPADYATSYNYWASKAKMSDRNQGIWRGIQYVANSMVGMKLMIPTYHALAMSSEISIASIALGIGEVAQGELGRGAWHMFAGATVIPSVAEITARGIRNQNEYLSKSGSEVSSLFAMTGGRAGGNVASGSPVGRQDVYRFGDAPSLGVSLKYHSLGQELKEDLGHVIGTSDESAAARAAKFTPRLIGFVGTEIGRVLNTFTSPMFDHWIPWIKQGAFGLEMDAFLRKNPLATTDAKVQYARMLNSSMDNRFGELNQNTLFWPHLTKQILNSSLVSLGWEYGSLRAFGNAVGWDVDKMRPAWNPVASRWAIGFMAGVSIQNSMYQYARTGQAPWDTNTPLTDLMIPRNGGTTPEGKPSRTILPGYQKDVFNIAKIFMQAGVNPMKMLQGFGAMLAGKLTPALQFLKTTMTGADPIGHNWAQAPIKLPNGKWRKADGSVGDYMYNYYQHVLLPAAMPIQVEQLGKGELKGSGLTPIESMLGIRSAAGWQTDPERTAKGMEKHDQILSTQEFSRMRRENARSAEPDPNIPAPKVKTTTDKETGAMIANPVITSPTKKHIFNPSSPPRRKLGQP